MSPHPRPAMVSDMGQPLDNRLLLIAVKEVYFFWLKAITAIIKLVKVNMTIIVSKIVKASPPSKWGG